MATNLFCPNCGTCEKPISTPKGSGAIEAFLWIASLGSFIAAVFVPILLASKTEDPALALGAAVRSGFPIALAGIGMLGGAIAVVYSIARRIGGYNLSCRSCGSLSVMPVNTPIAKQKLQEIEAAQMKAKYGAEVAAYREQIRSEIGRAPAQ